MTLSLFSVLLVLPFEGNELEPKSNLTVGMWTNSGRRVGAPLLVFGLAVLLAEGERKARGVAFAGFPLFGGSSVVVRGTGVVGWWATTVGGRETFHKLLAPKLVGSGALLVLQSGNDKWSLGFQQLASLYSDEFAHK